METLQFDFDTDDRDFERLFNELAAFTRKKVPQLVLDRAVTMARYLAENTQPVASGNGGAITNDNTFQALDGGSLKARDLGRTAVRRDLRRTYVGPSSVYGTLEKHGAEGKKLARRFYKLLKDGDREGARAVMVEAGIAAARLDVEAWDKGARHKRLRNKRGRVNRGNRPVVVTDGKALKAYTKEKENLVGFTKAAWVNAGRQISGRGMTRIRQWISKHTGAPGSGVNQTANVDFPRVILTNAVRWASEALSQKQFNRAQGQLANSLRMELEKALEKLAAKEARRSGAGLALSR